MKLIHLTDTHLVNAGELLYDIDPLARLEACIADINHHHADAELCVITGDLTHRGGAAEYDNLRACLDALRPPVRLVVGNHDDRARMLAVFPEVPTDTSGFAQSALDTPAGRLLFLDTVNDASHAGDYCLKRLNWLRDQLERAGERAIYLFMHHPPFKIGIPSLDAYGFPDSALSELIAYYPNVRHLFFGHVHRPVSGQWRGIGFSSLRATSHQFWLDFAHPELPISHEPPAYAVVLIEADSVIVHTHDYLYAGPLFNLAGTAFVGRSCPVSAKRPQTA